MNSKNLPTKDRQKLFSLRKRWKEVKIKVNLSHQRTKLQNLLIKDQQIKIFQFLQEPEEDQTSFDTERSFYSSHKSTFDAREQITRKKTNLNLIKEMMEEEQVSEGSQTS